MKAKRYVLTLLIVALPAWAAGPARNLLVELRWVESTVSVAAVAGVRDGSMIVGTAGSVSPQAGAVTTSTRRRDAGVEAGQKILVLNGHAASVSLSEQQPVQWLDYAVQLAPGARDAQGARVVALPRTSVVERTRGFVVTPNWPGGEQPVQLELKSITPEAQTLSTVQAPFDQWQTVARSGGTLQQAERGALSSRDAEGVKARELQIRVSLAP